MMTSGSQLQKLFEKQRQQTLRNLTNTVRNLSSTAPHPWKEPSFFRRAQCQGNSCSFTKDRQIRFTPPSFTFETIPPRIRLWYGFCPQSVAFARRLLSLRLQHGRSFISSMPWVAKKNLRHQRLRLFRLSLTIRLKVTCQPLPPHRNIVDNFQKGLRLSPLLWWQHLVWYPLCSMVVPSRRLRNQRRT